MDNKISVTFVTFGYSWLLLVYISHEICHIPFPKSTGKFIPAHNLIFYLKVESDSVSSWELGEQRKV